MEFLASFDNLRPGHHPPNAIDWIQRCFQAKRGWVPASTIATIFSGSGVEEHWSAFRTQTKASGWLALSDALITGDALNALVYYEARCGGTCGEGGFVWLVRDSADSAWRVAKRIVSWNS